MQEETNPSFVGFERRLRIVAASGDPTVATVTPRLYFGNALIHVEPVHEFYFGQPDRPEDFAERIARANAHVREPYSDGGEESVDASSILEIEHLVRRHTKIEDLLSLIEQQIVLLLKSGVDQFLTID